ncbi:MAG: hypoxanthine-guanine phosphoribosyltransferase [Gammaproteobacteria bacterium]
MSPPLAKLPNDAELLVPAAVVREAVARLAAELQPLIADRETVLLGVLNGGLIPLAWLAEQLQGDFLIDYCHATRYRGEMRGADLQWEKYPSLDFAGRQVVVVDDIFDEGITLEAVAAYCKGQGAAEVRALVLVSKQHDRQSSDWRPDFVGLEVPDRYVFGCGMDYAGRWRHLNDIYAVAEQ